VFSGHSHAGFSARNRTGEFQISNLKSEMAKPKTEAGHSETGHSETGHSETAAELLILPGH